MSSSSQLTGIASSRRSDPMWNGCMQRILRWRRSYGSGRGLEDCRLQGATWIFASFFPNRTRRCESVFATTCRWDSLSDWIYSHIREKNLIHCRNDPRAGIRRLLREGKSQVSNPLPLQQQECFRDLGYRRGDFPERAAAEPLALPIYPELKHRQLEYVNDKLSAYYSRVL
jgi:hypothetical protein